MSSDVEQEGWDNCIAKCPTGINGFDDIAFGGLPKGRASLVCGGAGCGKTVFSMEYIMRGAMMFDEPGLYVSFEETVQELTENFASFGYDVEGLTQNKKVLFDYVHIHRQEIQETGEYDLEGLFVRLAHAIESIGAKRVVLDSIEVLFFGFSDNILLRAELRRLFRWLKDQGVTSLITAERGNSDMLTRFGLEEYVADCVIVLNNNIDNLLSTRRLRIAKYRGSQHGTNEYPFLISPQGLSILPITSVGLNHEAVTDRLSTGIPQLDDMMESKGYFRGSTILVTGTAGTGKTSFSSHFVHSGCKQGLKCLFFAFEESQKQVIRNMRSVGVDLEPYVNSGLLKFKVSRPTVQGLEMHLVDIHKLVDTFEPDIVVFDPLTNLMSIGDTLEIKSMVTRTIDFLKSRIITSMFVDLVFGDDADQHSRFGVSSLADTWMQLRNDQKNGSYIRKMFILKSRGMYHSNEVREFCITDNGIKLCDSK